MLSCPEQPCPIAELDKGLALKPAQAGKHVLFVEFLRKLQPTASEFTIISSGCVEVVLQEDGTTSDEVQLFGGCIYSPKREDPTPSPDAGFDGSSMDI